MYDWKDNTFRSNSGVYRVGNAKLKLNQNIFKMIFYGGIAFLFVYFVFFKVIFWEADNDLHSNGNTLLYETFENAQNFQYNYTYPLSSPIKDETEMSITYNLMAIADMDTKSKFGENKYSSFLLSGTLKIYNDHKSAQINFDSRPTEISSQYAYGDRGMELSELVVFNGRLYSCDDRTGIVYEIDLNKKLAIPWVILVDGDGKSTGKGFKCEWMTVKNKKLYVGGLGKEWTTAKGVLVNHYPQWIKVIGHLGDVSHVDWTLNYNKIRSELGFSYPGYMIFESCAWSEVDHCWYFLPRRASKESYDENLDEQRAANLLIAADNSFEKIIHKKIGSLIATRGYSSFKFVPNTNEELIIALKSEEDSGRTQTYVTLFNLNGKILVRDTLISDNLKYEGIEFV